MLPFLLALCSLALGDESICVSNKGHPYDKAHCEEVAQKYGCVFKDNQCVCANGGYYAKTSHHCYPPSPTTTASTTTSTTTTTTTPVASSMCVCRTVDVPMMNGTVVGLRRITDVLGPMVIVTVKMAALLQRLATGQSTWTLFRFLFLFSDYCNF